jgi:SAM-dependent methyltransferase
MPLIPPKKINLGSGKDFRADCLNIDIDAFWGPDIIADVAGDFPRGGRASSATERFGQVEVAHGAFDEIISRDVLEHVPDLVRTMTNCLNLLKVGGVFNIKVPYDLSYGAWQDPTHIRAFNERSWLYYTDWFWYLNWTTHRFVMTQLSFAPSPLGQQMVASGATQEVVLRTPRAIDYMDASLQKIELSQQDRVDLEHFRPRRSP